jgi:hypothetical protein
MWESKWSKLQGMSERAKSRNIAPIGGVVSLTGLGAIHQAIGVEASISFFRTWVQKGSSTVSSVFFQRMNAM